MYIISLNKSIITYTKNGMSVNKYTEVLTKVNFTWQGEE